MKMAPVAVAFTMYIAVSAHAEDAEVDTDHSKQGGVSVVDEELITLGSYRKGDYSFITEDTQKLVETAGGMGDPLSAVFSLPGVVYSNGEGNEPAVRGSSPSDNQYVVDFMPASYIFHEFGVSIFSEYILHDFQMYSAGVGAEYGNVTGAVFDVTLRDPENKRVGGVVDLSMLRTGLFLEGGVTENSSFYLSYRKSLIHLFVNEEDFSDDDEGLIVQEMPQDTDYQFKYLWSINSDHKLTLSANGATDDAAAEFTEESDFARSNPDFAGDARIKDDYQGQNVLWEYNDDTGTEFKLGVGVLSDKSDLNWGGDYIFNQEQKISTIKTRYSVPLNSQYRISVGAQRSKTDYDYYADMQLFVCTEFDTDCTTRRRERIQAEGDYSWNETFYYLVNTWQPTDHFSLDLGMHHQTNDFTNESFTHPRIAAAFTVADGITLSAKAGRYNQFPELEFLVEETGNPALKSPLSNHYAIGLTQEFRDGWSVSIEPYFKTFDQLPLSLSEIEPDGDLRYVNETEGQAYGVDVMVNKNITDSWYGWVSLSYGKSERTNTRINETKEYHLDTPMIFNWVMNWQATESLNFGWRWSIRSGSAYTPIIGVQENPYFEGSVLPVYGDANSERLPFYNRLDFRMKWDTTTFGKESALIVDILNATNYNNVDDRVLDYDKVVSPDDMPLTKDVVDFGIQPAISYRVYF